MAFTRNDLCIRVLRKLNRLDVDNPPSAGDLQLVNSLIESSTGRLLKLNLIQRDPTTGASLLDVGSSDNINSGNLSATNLEALARVITRDVAADFGADPDTYEKLAATGEAYFAQTRFKGHSNQAPPTLSNGTTVNRLTLIYETLRQLNIVGINEPASDDAVAEVDSVIDDTLDMLRKRGIYAPDDAGSVGDTTSGAFPRSDLRSLAQVLTRPVALDLGSPFIKGQPSDYIQLAGDGEERLRQMREQLLSDEPISFRDF